MNFHKLLIKLSNKFENSWSSCDFSVSPVLIKAGWYVTEFVLSSNALSYTPRVVIIDDQKKTVERELNHAHAGRNRMLIYLPAGRVIAVSEGLEFNFLSRIPWWEGRARILLICGRYLRDFFSPLTFIRMLAMQFKSSFELSTQLLHFYPPAGISDYYLHIRAWDSYRRFAPQLSWWHRKIRVAVVIESESQRNGVEGLMVPPELIVLAGEAAALPKDIDFIVPLASHARLCGPAILMMKRTIAKAQRERQVSLSLVYTDHEYDDNQTTAKSALLPVFKPGPSAAYLYCFNYIGFSVAYARSSVEGLASAELFDPKTQYRLAIEAFNNTQAVLHIDELLFISQQQTPLATPSPLANHSAWPDINWQRRDNYNALIADNEWRDKPSIDLIIPTRDGLSVLKPCIDSLLNSTNYPNYKIIIVDNGSQLAETHQDLQEIDAHPLVTVVQYPGEFNYSAINNFAAAYGKSDYIGMINNDIEVINADWLTQMMVWAKQDEVGVVGAKLLFGNGLVQHAGVIIGMGNAAGHPHRLEAGDSPGYQNRCCATQNMMAVTAACLITPRNLFEQLKGLDEENFKVAYNDIDYCLRVEAMGLHVIWTPEAKLYHHESVSRGDDMSDQHVERYFNELENLQKRWKTKGFVDKYYSKYLRVGDEGVYPLIKTNATGPLTNI